MINYLKAFKFHKQLLLVNSKALWFRSKTVSRSLENVFIRWNSCLYDNVAKDLISNVPIHSSALVT